MVKAQQLVESLLDDDGSSDPRERAYRRLHQLYTRRGELQSEQKWNADFSITLHRLHVDKDNVKSLDVHDGKCYGVWLNQGDYGAKLHRKADAKAAQNKRLDAKQAEVGWFDRDKVPKNAAPNEVSAYYVPFNPPLWVPESVRDKL